jgi:MFS family permease
VGTIAQQLERALIGRFPQALRTNIRIELAASIVYGLFYACTISFLPIVLRRLGASSEMLAIYFAETYLGSVFAYFAVMLMRGRHPKTFATACWLLSRSLFLPALFIAQASWLLVVTAVFWLFEAFPAPAYARIVQAIYPNPYRGRSLAVVRVGMVLALLIATPLAGKALDAFGHQVVFPFAALLGIASALIFSRLKIDERMLPPRADRATGGMWSILLSDRRFGTYLLGFTLYGLGFLMGSPYWAIVQVDRLQLSYTTIGYLALVQSFCWLLGNIYWGRLVDKRGGLWVLRANVAIALLIPLSYIWASNAWLLLPAFIAQGLVSAGVDLGLLSTAIELADVERVAEYSALQATVIGARGMAAPFIGTALVALGASQRVVFGLGCGVMVVGWLVLGVVVGPKRRSVARAEEAAPVD